MDSRVKPTTIAVGNIYAMMGVAAPARRLRNARGSPV
jgi:hypothetical protein